MPTTLDPPVSEVIVYKRVRDAIRVIRPNPHYIVDPTLKQERVRNVLIEWRGKKTAHLTAAVERLR
jgi:hypothetical protein